MKGALPGEVKPQGRARAVNDLRLLAWLAVAVALLVFPGLVLGPLGGWFTGLPGRASLFAATTLLAMGALRLALPRLGWGELLVAALLANGTVYKIASYLPDLSASPFSLGWSEASRYYYASLFFSERLYGTTLPLPVLHPTRYLMQSLPYLLPALPISAHRLWQVLLWVIFTGWTALLLTRRLHLPSRLRAAMLGMWAFLFLLQGPVYYHLLVMPVVVFLGYRGKRAWLTWLVVLAASLWAGLSRINWAPVPGMLAASLYFLETPYAPGPTGRNRSLRALLGYLAEPFAWTILGTLAALVSQWAYTWASGNPASQFGSSFTSDLLWYRLLPSATYPLGVLPAAALVSLPVLGLALLRLWQGWRSFHPVRLLGLAAILAVLFAGGVVVSAKIGGGSNLHNLDAYLTLLAVIGAYVLTGQMLPDQAAGGDSHTMVLAPRGLTAALVFLLAAIPAAQAIALGAPPATRAAAAEAGEVEYLRQAVENAPGEVLFISERQLITFGLLEASLEPDYEKVFLMEMAMANNQPYLEAFYEDLRSNRFSLIVVHPQRVHYQGKEHAFGEENDAWVKRVTEPLLCYYRSQEKLPEGNIELLVPRKETNGCP